MQAGKLDRRISIEQKTKSRDSVGGVVETWSVYADRWAYFRTRVQDQAMPGDKMDRVFGGDGDVVFVIRYDNQVNADMRITMDGKVYSITSVREFEDGRYNFTEMIATART